MAQRSLSLVGKRYGRLVVLTTTVDSKVMVKCDCGKVKTVFRCNLKNGHTQSCGCLHAEMALARVSGGRRV